MCQSHIDHALKFVVEDFPPGPGQGGRSITMCQEHGDPGQGGRDAGIEKWLE